VHDVMKMGKLNRHASLLTATRPNAAVADIQLTPPPPKKLIGTPPPLVKINRHTTIERRMHHLT